MFEIEQDSQKHLIFKIKGIMIWIQHHLRKFYKAYIDTFVVPSSWLLFKFFKRIFYFAWYLAPYLLTKVGYTFFPFEDCIKRWNSESRIVS